MPGKCLSHPICRVMYLFALLCPMVTVAQPGDTALVTVAEARMQPLSTVALVPGTVVSHSDARLSAEVEGRLIKVAEVGTQLHAGDVVADIEGRYLLLRQQEFIAEIARAEARLTFLEKELERFTRLAELNVASANQYEQTRSERDVALGDLNVARARQAQNDDLLSKTRIIAPFSGVVVERLMTRGEWVTEGSAVVRLVDQDHLEVIARAPLEYFAYTRPGQRLQLQAGNLLSGGVVRTVVAVGDENTHLFEFRLDLQDDRLPAGQTVRIAIPTSDSREVLTVPRDALVLRPEGQSIFVVDSNNQASQVEVTTGMGSGESIEIIGNVSAGDRVVIRGNERLQPGQTVEILDG